MKADAVPHALPLVEISLPDLSPFRAGNTGIDYVWSFAAAAAGPHVILNALTHGNEVCGAIALDRLLRVKLRPARGKLTFCFANVAAYETFDRADPGASRCLDEDFNRLWDATELDGPRTSRELERARSLRAIVDTADFLLDIHSMTVRSDPLMLTGMAEKHLAFARRVGVPAMLVRDEGHAGGARLRDYQRFSDPNTPPVALLVECGQHWLETSADVALETAWRFLATTGILSEHDAAPWRARLTKPQRVVLVTNCIAADTDEFSFVERFTGLEVIPHAGTIIARDGARDVRTPYDDCVLIMPTQRSSRGQTAVRLGRFEE